MTFDILKMWWIIYDFVWSKYTQNIFSYKVFTCHRWHHMFFFAVKLKLLKQMWVGWKFSCFYKVFLELILSLSYFHECTNIIIVMIKILFQDKNYKLYSWSLHFRSFQFLKQLLLYISKNFILIEIAKWLLD